MKTGKEKIKQDAANAPPAFEKLSMHTKKVFLKTCEDSLLCEKTLGLSTTELPDEYNRR